MMILPAGLRGWHQRPHAFCEQIDDFMWVDLLVVLLLVLILMLQMVSLGCGWVLDWYLLSDSLSVLPLEVSVENGKDGGVPE